MARPVLESGRAFAFNARGRSMEPFLREGEAVTLMKRARYAPGDIVLARTRPEGEIVLHYIYGEIGDHYLLMGSANLARVERCAKSDVAGAVASPRISPAILRLWHRLLPMRRYIMWIYRKIAR